MVMMMWWPWGWNGWWGWGMWLGMGFLWLLFLAAVVAGVVLLVRAGTKTGGRSEALRILEERLARGEISLEEYERVKRLISS